MKKSVYDVLFSIKKEFDGRLYSYSGSCHGESKGFPYSQSCYDHPSNGTTHEFLTGADRCEGFVKIYERETRGYPAIPASYAALYVPEEKAAVASAALKKALQEAGHKDRLQYVR